MRKTVITTLTLLILACSLLPAQNNAANDAYKKRDRWLYVNIGLRVFSVLQTAWLNGLLGGDDDRMAIMGHHVDVVAAPRGRDSGTLGASLSF